MSYIVMVKRGETSLGLTRFIDDGRIEIDFNDVERVIRPIALNRKEAPLWNYVARSGRT